MQYEKGKPHVVSIDILKEFRGENNMLSFPSDEMVEIPNVPNKPLISDLVRPAPVTIDQNVIKPSWMGGYVNPYQDNEQRVDREIIGMGTWAEGKITLPKDMRKDGDIKMGPAEATSTCTNHSMVGDQEMTDVECLFCT